MRHPFYPYRDAAPSAALSPHRDMTIVHGRTSAYVSLRRSLHGRNDADSKTMKRDSTRLK
jgi:hypothetical protein